MHWRLIFGWNDFDPLTIDTHVWTATKPTILRRLLSTPWRSSADSRERLELFAKQLLRGDIIIQAKSVSTQSCLLNQNSNPTRTQLRLVVVQTKFSNLSQHSKANLSQPAPVGAPTRGTFRYLADRTQFLFSRYPCHSQFSRMGIR